MANSVPYRLVGLTDLYAQRVQQAGPERIWDAIAQSLGEYTRVANAIVGAWAQPTTVAMEQFELPAAAPSSPLTNGATRCPCSLAATTRSPTPSRAVARRSATTA